MVGSLVDSGIKLKVSPVLLTTWGDWLAAETLTLRYWTPTMDFIRPISTLPNGTLNRSITRCGSNRRLRSSSGAKAAGYLKSQKYWG